MDLSLDERTRICVLAADSRQADDIVVLDMTPHSSIADRFVICQGRSDRQVKAIADAVDEQLREGGEKPRAMEGYQTGSWILIDYVDMVVHVFDPETRGVLRSRTPVGTHADRAGHPRTPRLPLIRTGNVRIPACRKELAGAGPPATARARDTGP